MPPDFSEFKTIFHNVSRETYETLVTYYDLLIRWQKTLNLVGPSTLPELWKRHILDSLQLINFLPSNAIIADIGSGAGLPGIVLASAGFEVFLIESDKRKCAFLYEVSAALKLSVTVFSDRAEKFRSDNITHVTSRACGDLSLLINMMCNFSHQTPICLFHKGKNYTKELDELGDWEYSLTCHPSIIEQDSVILEISDVRRT